MALQYAARLALIAFATANVQGLLSKSDLFSTLQTGLLVAVIFFVLGVIIGDLARKAVEESVEKDLRQAFQNQASQELTSSNS